MALANEPRLLLMDEPTAGMSPRDRVELMALTAGIAREKNLGVLFTEHDMDVVFRHADRILVLSRGQLIAEGKPDEVRRNPEVQAVYLGEGLTYHDGLGAMTDMLSLQGLKASYGAAQVLDDVSFVVRKGAVTALLGRNGAGKSTTFKAIVGLIERKGSVRFLGREIGAEPTYRIARSGLGYVPEDRRIFTELTVEENLEVGRQPPRPDAPRWTPEKIYALFPNLAEMRRRAGGAMSGGEQQMLTIGRTLMGNPLLLMLDEPSEGIAPRIVEQMAKAILELKARGP